MNENKYPLQEMNQEETQDALKSVRAEILNRVQRLSEGWEDLMELNRKKRRIQIRLQCWVKLKDQ